MSNGFILTGSLGPASYLTLRQAPLSKDLSISCDSNVQSLSIPGKLIFSRACYTKSP